MAEKQSRKKKPPKPAAKKQIASLRKPASKIKTKPARVKKVKTKALSKKTAVKTKPKQPVKKPSSKAKAETAREKTAISPKPRLAQSRKVVKKPVAHPSEEERNEILRRTLLRKREEILKEARDEISKYIKGETRQLVDTALDDGDWSVVDLSEDISLRQLGIHRENLQKTDEALRKFREGTYGICEDCGDEINEERLKILPFAIYCIDCQERRERFQEMERREGLL
ncbi:MAG: TraR/DksA C4-type zinc finger protein [Thermodesulfovibrionales bacterium]|nr:TraR/DksA C4-type zinc finger protein [Thermodesulfovibrionales bacterium]